MLITHCEAVARIVIECQLAIKWNFLQDGGYADFDPLIKTLHYDKLGISFDLEFECLHHYGEVVIRAWLINQLDETFGPEDIASPFAEYDTSAMIDRAPWR